MSQEAELSQIKSHDISNDKSQAKRQNQDSSKTLKDFIKVFFVPVLLNKIFLLYFGLHYADHPGEGYGYGLVASILFLFLNVGRFLWKYRNVEDP